MNQTLSRPLPRARLLYDTLIVVGLLTWGAIFLFKMAYLRLYLSTPICLLWLGALYWFCWQRWGVKIPLFLLALIYASVALDGLGNLIELRDEAGQLNNLYNTRFRYFQYDEFTHTAIPALTAPVVVWLLEAGLRRFGYQLPLGLVTFFAITTMFTIAGFYEVIELWDDKYMHPQPGMRIHGAYDTANDLQCDLMGMIIGGLIAYAWLKRGSNRAPWATEVSHT